MKPAHMPSLYLPHGGGPSFFMEGERKQLYQAMEDFLRGVPSLLPGVPTSILIVTAHWETPVHRFTGAAQPALIYDYFGFPLATYQISYEAPGHPELAAKAAGLLRAAGLEAQVDEHYGWDHGVFIPLKVIYPQASIPVVAMSLQSSLSPELHCAAGQALRSLREAGVLIIGSGMSYHNLRNFEEGASASFEFDGWLEQALVGNASQRAAQLARWSQAPGGQVSHPREEHLMPLMLASGAGSDRPGRRLWQGLVGPTCASAWAFD